MKALAIFAAIPIAIILLAFVLAIVAAFAVLFVRERRDR
jgi:hypothetical protein